MIFSMKKDLISSNKSVVISSINVQNLLNNVSLRRGEWVNRHKKPEKSEEGGEQTKIILHFPPRKDLLGFGHV